MDEDLRKPDRKFAAPCGLFCPGCASFVATRHNPEWHQKLADNMNLTVEDLTCYGCKSERPSIFCRELCKMKACTTEKSIDFCGECDEYPCQVLKEFQIEMPHRIEVWESQKRIKEVGFE